MLISYNFKEIHVMFAYQTKYRDISIIDIIVTCFMYLIYATLLLHIFLL